MLPPSIKKPYPRTVGGCSRIITRSTRPPWAASGAAKAAAATADGQCTYSGAGTMAMDKDPGSAMTTMSARCRPASSIRTAAPECHGHEPGGPENPPWRMLVMGKSAARVDTPPPRVGDAARAATSFGTVTLR